MQLSFLVARALLEGDFASYFASVPSAADDPEPIVLRQGKFEREAVLPDGERGHVAVTVLVVREVERTPRPTRRAASAGSGATAGSRWPRTAPGASWDWTRQPLLS